MFFLILMLFSSSGMSEDTIDYVDIKKGYHAPFSGKLLTNSALAKILANNDAKIKEIKANNEFVLKKTKLDLGLKYDLLELKYNSEVKMYKSMIATRDKKIINAEKKDILQKWQLYGGFVLGAVSSIAIFYSVGGN